MVATQKEVVKPPTRDPARDGARDGKENAANDNENQLPGGMHKKYPCKRCESHNDIGHTTNECGYLKDEMENLIKMGSCMSG
uniref:Uncharacterized protein n=1 Tax=Cannabis sativa TaxID=3483 RepID=A0A803QII8_CANSA